MQLRARELEQLASTEHRFQRLRNHFTTFIEQLAFYSETRCPVRTVAIDAATDGMSVKVSFATVCILMTLHLEIKEQGVTQGRVLVHRLPRPEDKPIFMTSFVFNAQGVTDMKESNGVDPAEIDVHAVELVAHFLGMAIQQPQP